MQSLKPSDDVPTIRLAELRMIGIISLSLRLGKIGLKG